MTSTVKDVFAWWGVISAGCCTIVVGAVVWMALDERRQRARQLDVEYRRLCEQS